PSSLEFTYGPVSIDVAVNVVAGGGATDAAELTVDPATVPFAEPDTRQADFSDSLQAIGFPEGSADALAADQIGRFNTAMGTVAATNAQRVQAAHDGGLSLVAAITAGLSVGL